MFMVAVRLWHGMIGSLCAILEVPRFMLNWHLVVSCEGSQHSLHCVHHDTQTPRVIRKQSRSECDLGTESSLEATALPPATCAACCGIMDLELMGLCS